MASLDLSKFKKLESDDHCTTLKHRDGHELKIAHKALSERMKKELDGLPLAEGGEVDRNEHAKGIHHPAAAPGTSHAGAIHRTNAKHPGVTSGQAPKNIHKRVLKEIKEMPKPKLEGLAKGGEVKPSGAGVNRSHDDKEPGTSRMGHAVRSGHSPDVARDVAHKTLREMDRSPKPKLKGLAEGGAVSEEDAPEPSAQQSEAPPAAPPPAININLNGAPAAQGAPAQSLAPAQAPASPERAPQGQMAEPAPEAPAEPPAEEPAAPQMAAAAPAAQAAPAVDPKQAAKEHLQAQDLAWQQDLANGHIEPETYQSLFAKKDTLGKIGTVFGLLLSGAGSGLTHQPNALLNIMQNQIDRDLEAQKTSKTNAQNFLRLNMENIRNNAEAKQIGMNTETAAYALTQSQMMQSTYHDLVQKVDAMPEGPQKMAAKQQLAMVYSKIGEKINNINDQAAGAAAYQHMLFGGGGGGSGGGLGDTGFQSKTSGMRMLGPQGEARAQDMESKHIPGLPGQASIPLGGGDRESINSGIDFDQKLHRFMEWTKSHSGDLKPADRYHGQALAAELQGAYRQATHGGVYKEGEQNFISKLIDSEPTKFFNSVRVLPQLQAIAGENQKRVDQLVRSKGFPGYPGASGSGKGGGEKASSSGPKEGQTATSKSGKAMVYQNGSWRYK